MNMRLDHKNEARSMRVARIEKHIDQVPEGKGLDDWSGPGLMIFSQRVFTFRDDPDKGESTQRP